VTGREYPADDEWICYEPAGPGGSCNPNGGDVDAVIRYAKEEGKWVDAEVPF